MGRTSFFLFAALVAVGCGGGDDSSTPPSSDGGNLADAADSGSGGSSTKDSGQAGQDAGGGASGDAAPDSGTTDAGNSDSAVDAGPSDAAAQDVAAQDAAAQDAGCDPAGIIGADSDGDGFNDEDDCMPCDPLVNPNAGFHPVPRSDGLWDWNCDGVDEKQYPTTGKCVYPGCTKQQGFYKVPACGGKGELIAYCISNTYSCGIQWASFGSTTQSCR